MPQGKNHNCLLPLIIIFSVQVWLGKLSTDVQTSNFKTSTDLLT